MRRAKPISVRVRGLSRGLVTRLPGESADQMPGQGGLMPGAIQRAAARASNVRYEDGVVCTAPGYNKVALTASITNGLVAQWNMDELSGSRLDQSGNGHTLAQQTGVDVGAGNLNVLVGSEAGKFSNAAILTSIQPLACPIYTPLDITWSGAASNNYWLIGIESLRKAFVCHSVATPNAPLVPKISTSSDSYLGNADFGSPFPPLSSSAYNGLLNTGLVYASGWGAVVAFDQRGYYAFLDPATELVSAPGGVPNQVTQATGPSIPPTGYDIAYDSDQGLVVFSPANASYVVRIPSTSMKVSYRSDDFTGLSWGNHKSACCYNPAVKKVMFCSDSSATFPYWFFDTVTGSMTPSSLSIGSFVNVFYVPEHSVIVGAVLTGGGMGTTYVIDAATDTVIASGNLPIDMNLLGGAVYNPCAGTSGLLTVLGASGSNGALATFDPANSWAFSYSRLGFAASSVIRDKWSGSLYIMVANGQTVKKY